DKKCPLRRLSLDILPDKNFIELDSLEAIINIVQNGEGIAISPPDLTSDSSTNNIKVDYKSIPYYEYAFNKRT
ncbi:LysR family transcriptional regulator, partial [Staphylococcus succinus]